MLFALIAMALQPAPAPQLSLLCTQVSDGDLIRYLFMIDPVGKTFTATRNDTDPFKGTAELTNDTITLHRNDAIYISTYRISRTSGDMTVENRSPKYSYVGNAAGTCRKYTDAAF